MRKTIIGNSFWARLAAFMFNLLGIIIVWAVKQLARMMWWAGKKVVTHPRTSLGMGVLGGAVYLVGWEIVVGLVGVAVIGASVWKAADRESFDRFLGDFLAAWWRRWWVYRRTWERVMVRSGLAVEVDDEREIPRLVGIERTRYWDRLLIELATGQEVSDIRDQGERLRHAFRALRFDVTEVEPAGVELNLMRRDPFRHERIPATPMPASTAEIDWTSLLIGLTEHCEPWLISIVGAHLAVCGTSGAGKASIFWNIARAIAPAIADGTVRLHFIDPKRMELRQGRALVSSHIPIEEELVGRQYEQRVGDKRSSYMCGPEETAAMLRGLVAEMEAAAELAGERGERDHVPSPSTPLNLIVIDELAPLLEYWPRRIRDQIMESLGLILTQGRSLGYIVIGEIQEPTKDVFKIRDLFQRRIGLRLPTEAHTDAALTEHAAERGALCHQIPEDLAGVAFQLLAGAKQATRNRAGHVTNDDIEALVEYVAQLRLAHEFDTATTTETTTVDEEVAA